MSSPTIEGTDRLCTCGHDIWQHEDAEGGTHECNALGCGCLQFQDVPDAPIIEGRTDMDGEDIFFAGLALALFSPFFILLILQLIFCR